MGKVWVPPGCFSQQDCWLFPPTGSFEGKPPAFHLDTSLVRPTTLPHRSHQPHNMGRRWVLHHPHHAARCRLLHPASVSTYCFTSPAFGKTEGAKRGSVICTRSRQRAPDRLVKKAFFCTGGTCWYSPLAGTSSCPPRLRWVLSARGGLGLDEQHEASTPARSTRGMASSAAPKGCRDLLRLCHPQCPHTSRSLTASG